MSIASVIAPAPTSGASELVTTFHYDGTGRLEHRVLPDSSEEWNAYFLNGSLQKQWGSQRYPVEYSYDSQGRLKTQTTWQAFDQASGSGTTGAAVTQWNYDAQRGLLMEKIHADGEGTAYTYYPSGRLESRTWARGVSTTYAYDDAGQMQSIDYSDNTPDVAFTYTRMGQLDQVDDGTLSGG
jgi:YD repeat-containing protein